MWEQLKRRTTKDDIVFQRCVIVVHNLIQYYLKQMNLVPFNDDLSAALVSQHRMVDDYSTVDWKGVEERGLQR